MTTEMQYYRILMLRQVVMVATSHVKLTETRCMLCLLTGENHPVNVTQVEEINVRLKKNRPW